MLARLKEFKSRVLGQQDGMVADFPTFFGIPPFKTVHDLLLGGRGGGNSAVDPAIAGLEAMYAYLAEMDPEVVGWNYQGGVRTDGEYWREDLWRRIGGKELVALPWSLPTRAEMAGVCQLGQGQEVVAVGTKIAENRWWSPETAVIAGGGATVLVVSDQVAMQRRIARGRMLSAREVESVWASSGGGLWVIRSSTFSQLLNTKWFSGEGARLMMGNLDKGMSADLMQRWFESNNWTVGEDSDGLARQVAGQPERMVTDLMTGSQFWTLAL